MLFILLLLTSMVLAQINIINPLPMKKLAVGDKHVCTVSTGNVLLCWGYNDFSQFGTSSSSNLPVLVLPADGELAAFVSAGSKHTCILTLNGHWQCAGNLGGVTYSSFTRMRSSDTFSIMTSGPHSSCAYSPATGLWCMGDNSYGQLGDGTTVTTYVPVQAIGVPSDIYQMSLGYTHSCFISSSKVYCAGSNTFGQIGMASTSVFTWTGQYGMGIYTGNYHTCIYVNYFDGTNQVQYTLFTGLANTFGPATQTNGFVNMVQPSPIRPPTLGADLSFRTFVDGSGNLHIQVLGTQRFGSAGTGSYTYPLSVATNTIFSANGLQDEVQISTGDRITCVLNTVSLQVECMGYSGFDQRGIGIGTSTVAGNILSQVIGLPYTPSPTSIPTLQPSSLPTFKPTANPTAPPTFIPTTTPTNIPTMQPSSTPTFIPTAQPTFIPTTKPTTAIPTIPGVTLQPSTTPTLLPSSKSPTGTPSTTPTRRPTSVSPTGIPSTTPTLRPSSKSPTMQPSTLRPSVPPVANVSDALFMKKIAVGKFHACTISTGNTLLCWGNDYYSQFNDSSKLAFDVPVPLYPANNEVAEFVSAGDKHTCILTRHGQWQCVGNLGGVSHPTFFRLRSSDTFTFMTSGPFGSCAYSPVTGLWCVGDNSKGQFGTGTKMVTSVPVNALGVTYTVDQITLGLDHTCFVASMKVYCAGNNDAGQMGMASTTLFTWTGQYGTGVYSGHWHTIIYANYWNGTTHMEYTMGTGNSDTFGPTMQLNSFQKLAYPLSGRPPTLGPQLTFFTSVDGSNTLLIQVVGAQAYGSAGTGNTVVPYSVLTNTIFSANGRQEEVQIAAGLWITCVLSMGSLQVECVGYNAYNQRGIGSTVVENTATTLVLKIPYTASPTSLPTSMQPTLGPSRSPTVASPTFSPSSGPTSSRPTSSPSLAPSAVATPSPSHFGDTVRPSFSPTFRPSKAPSSSPSPVLATILFMSDQTLDGGAVGSQSQTVCETSTLYAELQCASSLAYFTNITDMATFPILGPTGIPIFKTRNETQQASFKDAGVGTDSYWNGTFLNCMDWSSNVACGGGTVVNPSLIRHKLSIVPCLERHPVLCLCVNGQHL